MFHNDSHKSFKLQMHCTSGLLGGPSNRHTLFNLFGMLATGSRMSNGLTHPWP